MPPIKWLILTVMFAFIMACQIATLDINDEATTPQSKPEPVSQRPGIDIASLSVPWDIKSECRSMLVQARGEREIDEHCKDSDLVAVAISGGGSRSAVFSAEVLFELERWGLLSRVDVISSVSGGSFTAALYATTCDPGQTAENCPSTERGQDRLIWEPDLVFDKLTKNYQSAWVWAWFNPRHFIRGWFTTFDRTDIMAEIIDNNLFDSSIFKKGLRFEDLNFQRPNLIVNATNFTEGMFEILEKRHFTFTLEEFKQTLNSDLASFRLADAVMASTAYPGAFHYVTLTNYSTSEDTYVHLFDAGTSDNLGLESIHKIIRKNLEARKLVILVDAYIPIQGKSPKKPDPRKPMDRIVDSNFIEAYDSLLSELREQRICKMAEYLNDPQERNFCRDLSRPEVRNSNEKNGSTKPGVEQDIGPGLLLHLSFDSLNKRGADKDSEDLNLYERVSRIQTALTIEKDDAKCLRRAARRIVKIEMDKLSEDASFKDMIKQQDEEDGPKCE